VASSWPWSPAAATGWRRWPGRSAARTANPNSANSQFFICFDDAPWLDRQYSVWGEVVDGMDHVDAIKKGGEHNNGAISGEPDKILKARIEADA